MVEQDATSETSCSDTCSSADVKDVLTTKEVETTLLEESFRAWRSVTATKDGLVMIDGDAAKTSRGHTVIAATNERICEWLRVLANFEDAIATANTLTADDHEMMIGAVRCLDMNGMGDIWRSGFKKVQMLV